MKIRGTSSYHLFHNKQNYLASINRLSKLTNFVQVNHVSLKKNFMHSSRAKHIKI